MRRLRVSHAFHSARMDSVLDELGEAAAGLEPLLVAASGVCEDVASRCEGLEAALGDVLLGCGVVWAIARLTNAIEVATEEAAMR